MSYGIKFYDLKRNRGVQAKIRISSTLEYVVNFIRTYDSAQGIYYEVFFHPSIKMINAMTFTYSSPGGVMGNPALTRNIMKMIIDTVQQFVDKYKPNIVKFTNQFAIELHRFTSASISGYHVVKAGLGDGTIMLQKDENIEEKN